MRTKPHTIRFDEEKLPEALKKAETDKVQRLVDILIDDFVKEKPKNGTVFNNSNSEEAKKDKKVNKSYVQERFEAKNKIK